MQCWKDGLAGGSKGDRGERERARNGRSAAWGREDTTWSWDGEGWDGAGSHGGHEGSRDMRADGGATLGRHAYAVQ